METNVITFLLLISYLIYTFVFFNRSITELAVVNLSVSYLFLHPSISYLHFAYGDNSTLPQTQKKYISSHIVWL